jgi:hypothetical protein
MTSQLPPICLRCKHYDWTNLEGNTCQAYPDGILENIMNTILTHTEPLPGDHGIQFEQEDPGTLATKVAAFRKAQYKGVEGGPPPTPSPLPPANPLE